jgi:gamma-glutamylputrescine oxidase
LNACRNVNYASSIRHGSAYDEEVGDFSPPSATNQNLTCDLLVTGGGISGLSAADAAIRRGLNVVVIEKSVYGKEAASGLNAGQFLTGWAKPVDTMIAELAQQDMQRGLYGAQAQRRAERRVRAFLRRTVEGCQRLEQLDRDYNLRASVQHGACTAAMTEVDMASLEAAYRFMESSNLRALMPLTDKRRPPFFEILSARQLRRRHGTAEGFYAGGVIDRFGGSFRPRKFSHWIGAALRKRGVRFFQHTEAQALDFSGHQMTVFCGNGATVGANTLFMANAYARHINGGVLERAIFEYAYVVEVELPEAAKTLAAGPVLSDTRDPCFYARRHGRRLYMGYEEAAETSPDITRDVARRTLEEGKRIFPELRSLGESDIKRAWAGRVYYTLDDYPFVERRHGGRASASRPKNDDDERRRRHSAQQLRLFENFPKGLRMRPGRRYQEGAFRDPESPVRNKAVRNPVS